MFIFNANKREDIDAAIELYLITLFDFTNKPYPNQKIAATIYAIGAY
jgi:hypothetical protein